MLFSSYDVKKIMSTGFHQNNQSNTLQTFDSWNKRKALELFGLFNITTCYLTSKGDKPFIRCTFEPNGEKFIFDLSYKKNKGVSYMQKRKKFNTEEIVKFLFLKLPLSKRESFLRSNENDLELLSFPDDLFYEFLLTKAKLFMLTIGAKYAGFSDVDLTNSTPGKYSFVLKPREGGRIENVELSLSIFHFTSIFNFSNGGASLSVRETVQDPYFDNPMYDFELMAELNRYAKKRYPKINFKGLLDERVFLGLSIIHNFLESDKAKLKFLFDDKHPLLSDFQELVKHNL